jgi:hypothetical protein
VLPPACHGRRRPSLLPFALLSEAKRPLAWRAWHLLASRFSVASIYWSVEARLGLVPVFSTRLSPSVLFHSLGCPQEGDTATSRGGFPSCHCLTLPALVPRLCLFWNAAEPSLFARFLVLIDRGTVFFVVEPRCLFVSCSALGAIPACLYCGRGHAPCRCGFAALVRGRDPSGIWSSWKILGWPLPWRAHPLCSLGP